MRESRRSSVRTRVPPGGRRSRARRTSRTRRHGTNARCRRTARWPGSRSSVGSCGRRRRAHRRGRTRRRSRPLRRWAPRRSGGETEPSSARAELPDGELPVVPAWRVAPTFAGVFVAFGFATCVGAAGTAVDSAPAVCPPTSTRTPTRRLIASTAATPPARRAVRAVLVGRVPQASTGGAVRGVVGGCGRTGSRAGGVGTTSGRARARPSRRANVSAGRRQGRPSALREARVDEDELWAQFTRRASPRRAAPWSETRQSSSALRRLRSNAGLLVRRVRQPLVSSRQVTTSSPGTTSAAPAAT